MLGSNRHFDQKRALFDDPNLLQAEGQLVFLPPDPAVDYMTFGGGVGGEHGFPHMFPRRDVLVLGGLFKLGDNSCNVESSETERVVQEHRKLF